MTHGGPHPPSVTATAPPQQMERLVLESQPGETISVGPGDMEEVLASERAIAQGAEQWSPSARPWDQTQGLQPQPTSVGFPAVGDTMALPQTPPSPPGADATGGGPWGDGGLGLAYQATVPVMAGLPTQAGWSQPPSGPTSHPSHPGPLAPPALSQPSFAPPYGERRDVPTWVKVAMVIGIACLFVAVALSVRFLILGRHAPLAESKPVPSGAPSAVSAVSARPTGGPAASPPDVRPPPEADPPKLDPEREPGRAALLALQKGIQKCVSQSIGVLPGTAPPIPPSFHFVPKDGYKSSPRDWSSPVYGCAEFSIEAPQRFVLQWQLTKPSSEGFGAVFYDDDGDKKTDKVLLFEAKLGEKREVTFGPIVEEGGKRAIVPAR